jgi:hypothetical protein
VAESSWPNPADGRVVDDNEWEVLATSFGAQAGVLGDFTSPQLAYGDSSGMQVKIAAGRFALMRGHIWTSGASIITKTIAANASGSTRTDLVVLRYSRTTYDVNSFVITGTPGSGAPSPVQNYGSTGTWDLPLATVTVASGASSISAGNVNYVGQHLGTDGWIRTPTEAAASYIPGPLLGQLALAATGEVMRFDGSNWNQLYGWQTWTPVIYQNMSTTRTTFGAYTVNRARYLKMGHLAHVTADVTVTGVTTGGIACSLPFAAVSGSANLIVGPGAILNSAGAATQDGFMIISNSLDAIQPVTVTTGFINSTTGSNRFRFTAVYETAS